MADGRHDRPQNAPANKRKPVTKMVDWGGLRFGTARSQLLKFEIQSRGTNERAGRAPFVAPRQMLKGIKTEG